MRVAAIDCGTNSIRLLIADLTADLDGSGPPAPPVLTDVSRDMTIVRLGQGVDRTGRLDPAAIERTRVALADYADRIQKAGAERVRMVATSASRDAENAQDFRAMVRATLGAESEVITGDDEARLSYAGAIGALTGIPGAQPPYLVLDIGGGSTEFVLGGSAQAPNDVEAARSVDVGCVRLTERHLHDDPPTAEQIAAARKDIVAAIGLVRETVPLDRAGTLVGLAGSVTTVAALALGLERYDPDAIHRSVIARADVVAVTERLLAATREERAALPVMHPGRVDVIGAGALILRTIMDEVDADQVVASEHDILDGIALSLA
jgi:exopolyphosphatase/guanosine-5'-triphosphate,3'-diphosphate pyrophosphatase